MQPAFIIIDMQKQFFTDDVARYPRLIDIAPLLNHIASKFQRAKLPVIWVQDYEDCDPGDPKRAIVDELEQQENDIRISKIHGNAFRDTDLASVIDKHKIDFLLLSGFMAEGCVLATAKGAEDRDIAHAVLRGGIVSQSREDVKAVENILPIISYEVVEVLVDHWQVSNETR